MVKKEQKNTYLYWKTMERGEQKGVKWAYKMKSVAKKKKKKKSAIMVQL